MAKKGKERVRGKAKNLSKKEFKKIAQSPPPKAPQVRGDGFAMVFECWKCKHRISRHYGRLESVNSNTVGNCENCGAIESYDTVKRISDR